MASELNYTTLVNQIITMNSIASSTDNNFTVIFPGCIAYAEGRCYRELDLIATQITDASATVSSGNRAFNLPTSLGTYLVVDQINIISSAGLSATAGTRNPVTFTSREYVDIVYPSATSSNCGLPQYAAMASDTQVIFGPAPDAPYTAEVVGTQRPTPLSSANSSTFLTQVLPDLFVAACMIYMSGYQMNFGSMGDNPQTAVSWEQQYAKLFASANVEELRKKRESEGWTSQQPSPIASPPRV